MKVYVLHPFCGAGRPGERDANMKRIAAICRDIIRQGHVPISPIHALSFLDDHDPNDRRAALDLCEDFIDMADVVWAFVRTPGLDPGPTRPPAYVVSQGCLRDMTHAARLCKPVTVYPYAPLDICELSPQPV